MIWVNLVRGWKLIMVIKIVNNAKSLITTIMSFQVIHKNYQI
jgi:hypothetical protein